MTSLKVEWDAARPLKMVVHDILTDTFMLRGRETVEERIQRKTLEAFSTPAENLRRLFDDGFDSQFRATPIYSWLEANAPGYKVGASRPRNQYDKNRDVVLIFDKLDHVMLFKLTWV